MGWSRNLRPGWVIYTLSTQRPWCKFGFIQRWWFGGYSQKASTGWKSMGLKISVEADRKCVDFLDVTLDLNSNSYKPFIKPNNSLQYVHIDSNHPPHILKNIPVNINKRLSVLSSSELMFNSISPEYQKALDTSGYKFKLRFIPQQVPEVTETRRRQRKQNSVV